MTVTLNLSSDVEQELVAKAKQRGISPGEYLQEIVTLALKAPTAKPLSGKERARTFERWAASHRYTPPLPAEAIRRESLIREDL